MKPLLLFALLSALLLTAPAFARRVGQGAFPAPPPGVSVQLPEMLGNVLKPANTKAASVSTRFTPTGKPLFVDEMLSKITLDAGQEEPFRKYVADLIKDMETAYAENGYETNDLSVALGGLLEVCYELDQGTLKLNVQTKAEQAAYNKKTRAVVRQMQRALGSAPAFKSLSDTSKQMAYEACAFTTGHLATIWQDADKDANKQMEVRQLARQQIEKLFRLDPDAITRNAEGEFIPKKKSGEDKPDAAKADAAAAERGLDVEKVPATPRGLSPGGELEPGLYTGTKIYEEKVKDRYRLYLYPNGQYRLFNAEGRQLNNDVRLGYTYNQRTGKLNLDDGILREMMNNPRDPDDDFCLYGRDAEGKPYVYARYNRGFGYATTTLRYAGPPDKPSPQEETDSKARAEAEAKRYKWVVPPGQGLKPSQIAGILHNAIFRSFYNGSDTSFSASHELYLLLTDGTVYNGLPVAPDEMDVARSHRNEPEKWGHWKRAGAAYLAAWPDAPNQYKPLKGVLVKPGVKGTKLTGRFGTGEASGNMWSSLYRSWGVTLTPEGHFVKDKQGSYSSGMGQSGDKTDIHIHYDDKRSGSSFTRPGIGVNSNTEQKPDADRSGTYSLEGYVLTLRYEDGRVKRLPFFFDDAKQDAIWFEGALLILGKADADKNKARTK